MNEYTYKCSLSSSIVQAMVQKEQLVEELNNMKQRFDAHIHGTQQKMNEEREIVRKESKVIIDELNTKVGNI